MSFPRILSLAVLALGVALPAAAQSAKNAALPKSANVSAAAGGGGKWICFARKTVEIAPVSHDVRGRAESWVVVYRDKGEVVASQRVDERELDQIRRMPCGPDSQPIG